MSYIAKQFTIPDLKGISRQTIDEHYKLYEGYVKNANHILNEIEKVADPYAQNEMRRRLGFEFGGMKNHERYFTQFEGGAKELPEGKLKEMLASRWGSTEAFVDAFKKIAMTRGIGWAMLYHDPETDDLVVNWIDEQHLGQLPTLEIVLGLDMWEHSYMLDYPPSNKAKYIDAFFNNLNWEVVAKRV